MQYHLQDRVTLAKTISLHVMSLNQNHIDQVIHLRERVLSTLPHPDYYTPEQDEYLFVAQHCGEIGETFGVFAGKSLVAYAALGYHQAHDPDNLGRISGLAPAFHDHVSHLASCMIIPEFQRTGLHKLLIQKRIKLAQSDMYYHCLTHISQHNRRSRHNLLQAGFYIRWAGPLPGLSNMHILYRNVKVPPPAFQLHLTQQVKTMDISSQRELLQQGYYGYAEANKGLSLLFAPLLPSDVPQNRIETQVISSA